MGFTKLNKIAQGDIRLRMPQLAARLNNLRGDSIGEKRRDLFLLLNSFNSNKTDQDVLIESIKPNGYLEDSFKVDVLLHLKRFEELFELFKTESRLVYKILKNEWFCEALTKNVPPERLVDEIFPTLCLVVRLKLLNKIVLCCNDTKYIDRLFDSLEETYGLKMAIKLLPGCSPNKIQNVIVKYDVKLPQGVQLKLAKRTPETLRFYYERQVKMGCAKKTCITSKELCKFLVENHPEVFWFIYEHCQMATRLGYRTADKAIKHNKEAAMKKPTKLLSVIRENKVAEYFGGDFEQFYRKWFPKNIEHLNEYSKYSSSPEWRLLRSLPRMKRYEIFNKTFEHTYDTKLIDKTKCITPELLENIKEGQIRHGYAQAKVNLNRNEWHWLTYLQKEKAIDVLKDKIKLTSNVKTRRSMIAALISVCKINSDEHLLLDVLKYFVHRHRNEDTVTHTHFLTHLNKHFDLKDLGDEYWEQIDLLIAINKVAWTKNWWEIEGVFKKRLERALKKNSSEDEIKTLFNYMINNDRWWAFYYCRDIFKCFTDEHITMAVDVITGMYADDDKSRAEAGVHLLQEICRWNRRKGRPKLTYPTELFKSINYLVETNTLCDKTDVICTLIRAGVFPEIYDHYWKCYDRNYDRNINVWFLTNKPDVILTHFGVFAKDKHLKVLCDRRTVDLCLKNANLCEMLVKACKDVLGVERSIHKIDAVKLLARLQPSRDFFASIVKYLPQEPHFNVTNETERLFFSEQCAVAENLFNVRPPIEAVDILEHFLKGDYLKAAVCSLPHLLSVIPQNKIGGILERLKSKPIAVQKNIASTYCHLFDTHRAIGYLEETSKSARHVSIRKHLFVSAFRYFHQNPYEECWRLLQTTIGRLDKNDTEAFELAVQIPQIPPKYRTIYMPFIWMVLCDNEKRCPDLKDVKYKMFARLKGPFVRLLPKDFLIEVITGEFCKKTTTQNRLVMEKFVAKCLLNCPAVCLNELLEAAMGNLKNCTEKDRFDFIRILCARSMKATGDGFDRFVNTWRAKFTETETFRECIFLHLFSLYHKNPYCKLPALLVGFFEDSCKKYTTAITKLFVDASNDAFRLCLKCSKVNKDVREESVYVCEFIERVFVAVDSIESQLLVLGLIKKDTDVHRKKFDYILEKLRDNCADLVKPHLNDFKYLRDDE